MRAPLRFAPLLALLATACDPSADDVGDGAVYGADGGGATIMDAAVPGLGGSVRADAGALPPGMDAGPGAGGPSHGGTSQADAGVPDASAVVGADAGPDAQVDASLDASADAGGGASGAASDEWLKPMNAARAAVGVAPLVWNEKAAQVALAYAQKCSYAHNASRNADYSALGASGGLGENIAAGAPTETPTAAVASWVNEKASYTYATNSCASGKDCGHYTQVVWAKSTSVGCAHVRCSTGSPFPGFGSWEFNVCDYAPPGNFVGQKPY